MGLSTLNSFISAGATSLWNLSFSRGVSFALCRAASGARCSSCCAPPFFSFLSFAIIQLLRFIQRRSAFPADPDFAVSAYFMSNAHRPTGGAHQLHLGDGNRALLLGDSTFRFLRGTEVLLHHHHVLDQDLPFVGEYAQHASLLAAVLAAQHLNGVIAVNINSFMCRCCRCSHIKIQVAKLQTFK